VGLSSRKAVGFALGLGLVVSLLNPAVALARPDLIVSTLGEPPSEARAGDTFALQSVVSNVGPDPTTILTTVKFYLMDGNTRVKNLKGVQAIDPLPAGQSQGGLMALSVYSDTEAGVYTVQACADADGDVSEVSNDNNCTDALTQITILESPDLVVTSVQNPVSTAGQNQEILAKSTVKNLGLVDAPPTITKYWLVSTANGSRHDLSGTQQVPLIEPGDSVTTQANARIRPETPPGQYKLQACANTGSAAVPEGDEENNCLTSSGNIQVTAVADLVITSVTVAPVLPTTLAPNAEIAFTVVVKNNGLAQARSSTMKFLLLNTSTGTEKNLNGTTSIPVVNAGASVTVQKTVKVYSDTASGTYTVQACADSAKIVVELSDNNNCGNADGVLTVQGVTISSADLVVTSVANPPTSVLPSATFDVAATVKNQGTDAAPASITSFFLVNASNGARKNTKLGQNVPGLAPGEFQSPTGTITLYSDTVPAAYFLEACADGPRSFLEANENNNCARSAGTITVQQVPNLVVSSITNPPGSAPLGSKFNVTNSVRNTGSVPAGATGTKYYLVSIVNGDRYDLKGSQAVPQLNAGQTFSLQVSVEIRDEAEDAPPTGSYKLQACADGDKVVVESNEDDNCMTSSGIVKVVGPPDLMTTSVTVRNAPLTVARGGAVTITAAIKNFGEGTAAASTARYWLVNAQTRKNLNGTHLYPQLTSGSSSSVQKVVTVFSDTVPGVYNVQVCADGNEVVPEVSETNNCFDSSTTVTVQ
jgi:uncharacterized membrane protein